MPILLLTLFACGDVSNAIFAEDGDFYAAFPADDRQTLDFRSTAASTARAASAAPELLQVTVSVSGGVNVFIFEVLSAVDGLRSLPPSTREPDGRTWGPYRWQDAVDVAAWMNRSGEGRFDWGLDGEGATFLAGTHYAGETVASGDGQFVWDHTRVSGWLGEDDGGTLTVDYDNRQGVDLLVDVADYVDDGSAPQSSRYAWTLVNAQGDFQYKATLNLPGDGTTDPADIAVRTRWVTQAGGRGDATLTGGGLGALVMHWSQCWDSSGALVYQYDDLGVTEPMGDAGDCAWADFAEVERI